MPGSNCLPPARILWDHIFYDENRPDNVREWLKSLSPFQLATVLTVTQSTRNLTLSMRCFRPERCSLCRQIPQAVSLSGYPHIQRF